MSTLKKLNSLSLWERVRVRVSHFITLIPACRQANLLPLKREKEN